MDVIEVVTGARLHFGLICGEPASEHRFGGLGLMLQNPRWRISASLSDDSSCDAATSEVGQRIETILPDLCQYIGVRGMRVNVHDEIPLHRGLGAGTQLTLALASIARVAAGLPRPTDSMLMAAELHRVHRSAVGAFGFDRGGLIVDYGHAAGESSRCLHKYELPDPWRVVLLSPVGAAGLSGAREESVFREERYMTQSTIDQQTGLILDEVVPAAQQNEFDQFCNAIWQYGRNAGTFFAPQQGGVYSSEIIRLLSETQEFKDLQMIQSSWGPTAAVFARSTQKANEVVERILGSAFARDLRCQVVQPLNSGAIVRTAAPENSNYVVRG